MKWFIHRILSVFGLIEHIDRTVAEDCLKGLKKIARKQIVSFTPIGFMPQDPNEATSETDQWGMKGVEWQKHLSGWVPEDFPAADGWSVIASKNFHQVDGYDRPLDKPFGAMWAIWNRS